MGFTNIEIKATCSLAHQQRIKAFLKQQQAEYRGRDHQIDTYFKVTAGRLKLREGTIENHLIHYERENEAGPRPSDIMLYESAPEHVQQLKSILEASLGILTVVDKIRHIYFIENVKFHLDEVQGLGRFVEIEAIDTEGCIGRARLLEQCKAYREQLNIPESNLISYSYSDVLLS